MKKQFLLLLLSYFAIPTAQSALTFVRASNLAFIKASNWEHWLFFICTLLVLIMLYKIKENSIDKRYRTGLLLIIVGLIAPKIIAIGLHVQLNQILRILLMIVPIVGIFLFINASPVNKTVNIIVKCASFIPSVLYPLWGIVVVKTQMNFAIMYPFGLFAMEFAILISLVLLLRKELS